MRSPDLFAIVTLAIKRGGAWSNDRWRHFYSSKWENNQPISPLPTHTFIESDAKFRNHPEDIPSLDSDQPSMADVNLGICESGGCQGYKFLSKANEARQLRRVECLNVSAGNHHFHFHLA